MITPARYLRIMTYAFAMAAVTVLGLIVYQDWSNPMKVANIISALLIMMFGSTAAVLLFVKYTVLCTREQVVQQMATCDLV